MRSALLTPFITILAVIAVVILLSIFFIPQLASMFQSLNLEIPLSTRRLLTFSEYMRSSTTFVATGICCCILYVLIKYLKKSSPIKQKMRILCFKIPFMRLITIAHAQATYFSFLSLLLQAHIQLPKALTIIAQTTTENDLLRDACTTIANTVHTGTPFHVATSMYPFLFEPHHIATIAIAQETDSLAPAMQKLSEQGYKKIDGLYSKIIFWIGPLLLLCLGLFVALLIIAIYSPLLNLSLQIQ
jgi:type II secretory pathway component PulF